MIERMKLSASVQTIPERGSRMKRFLMCSYGAVIIDQEASAPAEILDTVVVSRDERYRVLQTDNGLRAVRVEWSPTQASSGPMA